MAQNQYEYILIGAGHNGLVAAAYLAKQGKKVLVLERRAIVGGSVVTESFGEGFTVDSVFTGGTLRPDIVKRFETLTVWSPYEWEKHPLYFHFSFARLLREASLGLILDPDPTKAAESLRNFSTKDAARWGEFVRFMDKSAKILEKAYSTIMPRLPMNFGV
jgi:phytoene dehydrogenase-like protein